MMHLKKLQFFQQDQLRKHHAAQQLEFRRVLAQFGPGGGTATAAVMTLPQHRHSDATVRRGGIVNVSDEIGFRKLPLAVAATAWEVGEHDISTVVRAVRGRGAIHLCIALPPKIAKMHGCIAGTREFFVSII